jgi:hypothetical protein
MTEHEGHMDLRDGWRHAPVRDLADHMLTWLARRALEAAGLPLMPSHVERADPKYGGDVKLAVKRADILARYRSEVIRLTPVRTRGVTCGEVYDLCMRQKRDDIAREVELWAIASLKPGHLPVDDTEQDRLFEWGDR